MTRSAKSLRTERWRNLNEDYRASGVELPETTYVGSVEDRKRFRGSLIVAPSFYRVAMTLPDLREMERRRFLKKVGSVKKMLSASKRDLILILGNETGTKVFDTRRDSTGTTRGLIPLVAIRYVEPDGDADNLLPKSNYRLDDPARED